MAEFWVNFLRRGNAGSDAGFFRYSLFLEEDWLQKKERKQRRPGSRR